MGEADFDRRRTALPVARRAGIHKPPPERTSEPPAVKADDTTRELISSMLSSSAGRQCDNANSLRKVATVHLPSRRRRDYNWLELTEPMIHELRDELFSSKSK